MAGQNKSYWIPSLRWDRASVLSSPLRRCVWAHAHHTFVLLVPLRIPATLNGT